ncbi:hypothetical protein GCM10022199_12500 [Marihabitans asiaticum]|uniref:2TM domain-containing protein n=1 Tax=Marihabitans asiaticum TaxID=415218 RepID=A0A560WHT9_9MICO|nr:hypothetical protein [Marihabitans asiaticum]TWD17263.1 hypothetical protein FB557_0830 [Marihabitans asiaticum]
MLYAIIVGSELGFWLVLLAGLVARYPLRRPRLGAALLVAAPLVDLVTLCAAVLDLRSGADPSFAHTLAAIYIGVSVGFGHSMMRWADVRFAHRYAGGPPPAPKPEHGPARARHETDGMRRHAIAWVVGAVLLVLAGLLVGTSAAHDQFYGAARLWTIILVIDLGYGASVIARERRAALG